MVEVHYEKVWFTGSVQGVGFRYTAFQVAKEFEVTGMVTNLADGRVQLEAEGNLRAVNAFIMTIEERLHGHIRKVERMSEKRAAKFNDFSIP